MNEKEVIAYWKNSSKKDFETGKILYQNKRYHYALFFCHLSIEKMLKALVIKKTQSAPPLIHDLVRLVEKTGVLVLDQYKKELAEISTFNIQTRYDDYKLSFYKKVTKQFLLRYLDKTKVILKWLNEQF
ncbi:hypothetical protein MNBD_UNCLBAC01-1335 [hydrothermal vent metagenome]|uniref:HEPN domain-containing protein n=1 Tax=hydrothermal vent metagenome TaxID=652676 RepID=A0A3B1DZM1_9ZZZZ